MNVYYKAFGIGINVFVIHSLITEPYKIITQLYGLQGKLFVYFKNVTSLQAYYNDMHQRKHVFT